MNDLTTYTHGVCEVCGAPRTIFVLDEMEYLVCTVVPEEHGPDSPPKSIVDVDPSELVVPPPIPHDEPEST